jgi:hypothetical protein
MNFIFLGAHNSRLDLQAIGKDPKSGPMAKGQQEYTNEFFHCWFLQFTSSL